MSTDLRSRGHLIYPGLLPGISQIDIPLTFLLSSNFIQAQILLLKTTEFLTESEPALIFRHCGSWLVSKSFICRWGCGTRLLARILSG